MTADYVALTRNAPHGKRSRYIGNPAAGIRGCRCPKCSAANSEYHANLNARKRAIERKARDAIALEQAKEKIRIANAQQGNRPEPEVTFPRARPEQLTKFPGQVSAAIQDVKRARSNREPPKQARQSPEPIAPAQIQPVCGICGAPAIHGAANWFRCEQHKWS